MLKKSPVAKRFSIACGIVLLLACSLSHAALNKKGIVFGSWWHNGYSTQDAYDSLDNLADTGANYVGILATWYMDSSDGTEYTTYNNIYPHAIKSPTDASLIDIIQRAKAKGLSVALKLHVRVILSENPWDDKWAGNINPSDPAAWFNSYRNFVNHYADLCESEGVDLFIFGTELNSMTLPANSVEWDSVVTNIRSRYSGEITFSSNMYLEYTQITFWDQCDYLGIGPYFSLTEESNLDPSLDEIVDGWHYDIWGGNLVENMKNWQSIYDKPVIFTEIGYCAVDTSPFKPWKGTSTHPDEIPLPLNLDLQKKAYDALHLVFEQEDWFDGIFWWVWETDPNAGLSGLSQKNYTPQNKPAEDSIRNFYKGIQTPISTVRIEDGDGNEVGDLELSVGGHYNFYLRAYDALAALLGFIPGTWSFTGDNIATALPAYGAWTRLKVIGNGSTVLNVTSAGRQDATSTISAGVIYLRVPSEYATITEAVAAAQEGNVILVAPGTYAGGIRFYGLIGKNGIKLISEEGAETTIIDGGEYGVHLEHCDDVIVEGFTIRNTTGNGIFCDSADRAIIRNNIIDNGATGATGVYIWDCDPKIYNNVIRNNNGEHGGGIHVHSENHSPEIINNVIINNSASEDGGGIYVFTTPVIIKNNIVTGNTGGSVTLYDSPASIYEYNDVWNNSYDFFPGTNVSLDPKFVDVASGDYHLQDSSPCINAGDPDPIYNDSDGSRNDMGIYGGPYNSELEADEFVVVFGDRLVLENSRKNYYFSSTNQYYLFYKPIAMVDEVFEDAQAMGINVLRTWGFCDGPYNDGIPGQDFSFQPTPGDYNKSTFQRMDYLIWKARECGMRLIIPFVNNWGGIDNFGGMDAYVSWSTTGATAHDDFYTDTDCRNTYKNYVAYFLNRVNTLTGVAYKDDPTILMWELANEPRCQSDTTGDTLQAWIEEMSAHIKSIDTNHLVSTGGEGWYNRGTGSWWYNGNEGTDFIRNNQSPNIDICSFHLLYDNVSASESTAIQWIKEHLEDAHFTIGKPVYFGEFGKRVYRTWGNAAEQMATRNRIYTDWYDLFLDRGAEGAGVWLLSADNYEDGDNYTVYYPGDTETHPIVSNFSDEMANLRRLRYLPPILKLLENKTVNEQEPLEFQLIVSNPDSLLGLNYAVTGLPPGATVDNTGYFTWPLPEAGVYNDVEFSVSYDTSVSSSTIDINVTDVNGDNTPQIADIPTIFIDKNTTLDNVVDLWAVTTDDETPVANLIFDAVSNSPQVDVSVDSNRYIDIAPDPDYAGTTSFYIYATDERGLTGEKYVSLVIVSNETINVDPLDLDYPTITDAVSVAVYGDTILVAPGTYDESFTLNNGVSLIGTGGAENTIINGGIELSTGNNDYMVIEGLTISNPSGNGIEDEGYSENAGSPIIRNNIIENNYGSGISVVMTSPRIYNNIIREHRYNRGVYSKGGSTEIINNVIVGNGISTADGGGIYIEWSAGKVFNNILINNEARFGGGIKVWEPRPEFEIGYNDAWNNTASGGSQHNYGGIAGPGALETDPLFKDTAAGDYRLQDLSPCIDTGNPDPIYNDLDGSRNDMGIYGGPYAASRILNLVDIAWYQNELPFYTGAAACQMILNYIREGAAYPLLTQDEIYNYAHSAPDSNEMTPDEIDMALGHFDPYDEIISNSYDTHDSDPDGNAYQGYNFTVDVYESTEGLQYMRDICHWIAYPVTQEGWWLHGDLVARPNTPAAVPIEGNYNWTVVKGFAADKNPLPDPYGNPFETTDFTVYGLWFKDPRISGIGQDTYKTAAECMNNYLLPLTTGDSYDGKFVQVAEPPPQISDAEIKLAKPVSKLDKLYMGAGEPVTQAYAMAGPESGGAKGIAGDKKLNKDVTCEALVDAYILSDDEFKEAISGTRLKELVKVRRLDKEGGDYSLLPFWKENASGGLLTYAVVKLGSESGDFQEVTWVKEGQEYLSLSENKALNLVRNYLRQRWFSYYWPAYRRMMLYYFKRGDIKNFVKIIKLYRNAYKNFSKLLKELEAQYAWRPSQYSASPFYPYWEVTLYGRPIFYVTQEGKVVSRI